MTGTLRIEFYTKPWFRAAWTIAVVLICVRAVGSDRATRWLAENAVGYRTVFD